MKNTIFGITILAVLTHINPAYANATEVKLKSAAQPITDLINDWSQFRARIIARTSQYDKYSSITPGQLATLPQALIGKWNMFNRHDDSGYQIHAVLDLKKDNRFSYDYAFRTGRELQHWTYSGDWQVKNNILVFLIRKSNYPGELPDDILFWRVLHIGHTSLVYVRSGADQMQAMTRQAATRGS